MLHRRTSGEVTPSVIVRMYPIILRGNTKALFEFRFQPFQAAASPFPSARVCRCFFSASSSHFSPSAVLDDVVAHFRKERSHSCKSQPALGHFSRNTNAGAAPVSGGHRGGGLTHPLRSIDGEDITCATPARFVIPRRTVFFINNKCGSQLQ